MDFIWILVIIFGLIVVGACFIIGKFFKTIMKIFKKGE